MCCFAEISVEANPLAPTCPFSKMLPRANSPNY